MRLSDFLGLCARTGTAGVLAATFAAQSAQAALPTGHMLEAKPSGPARADLPSWTSINATRIPSAAGYGITGRPVDLGSFFAGAAVPGPAADSPFDDASPAEDGTPPRELAGGPNPFEGTQPVATTAPVATAEPPAALPVNLPEEAYAGLRGICPVTLRDERRSVKPRPEIFCEHAGRHYEFATPQAKAAFEGNPDRYAPALGGRDVVLTAGGSQEAVGTLKHAGFYRERLYLFQSEESFKAFHADPQRFLVGE